MRKAFTLIELLVVISIIALLIAILLPVLSKTHYSANITKCGAVLKGISGVQLSYATDNDGFFPTAGTRYTGTGSWFQAQAEGAQVRSWELKKPGRWDLLSVYQDYLQHDGNVDEVLNCPLATRFFIGDSDDESTISYMIYTTNNYRIKTNNYHKVGGYEMMDNPFSPRAHPDQDFAVLASDFAYGRASGTIDPGVASSETRNGALSTHPAPNGYLAERLAGGAATNDAVGYILGETQDAPLNYADVDGSVQQFKLNANSYLDTENWSSNRGYGSDGGFGFMIPRALEK